MMRVSGSRYRPDIDGIRAIAVLSVLLFHLEVPGFNGGFVGVDIFFVISGFLITRLILEEIDNTGTFSFGNFYIRRFRRLFPALFSTLFLTTCAASLLLSPAHLNSYGGSLTSSLASVSNIYFWLEADYFDVSARVKPLLHTWSLSIEEQFYLFWPFTLYIVSKAGKKWLTLSVLVCMLVLSLYLNVIFSDGSVALFKKYSPTLAYFTANGRSTIFFLIPFRVFEFALGGLLVRLTKVPVRHKIVKDLLFLIGGSLILYAVLFFDESLLFPSYYALVPCLGTGLLIFVGNQSRFSFLLSNRLCVGFGLVSYSLYLVHWPLIIFWGYMTTINLGLVDRGILFCLSVGCAILSYHFIECPFRYRKLRITSYAMKGSVALAVLLVAAIGVHMKMNYGWPWRVKSPVVFENVGDAAKFHISFYGGAGYPFYGPVNTSEKPDIVLMGDSHGRQYAEGIYKEWAVPDQKNLYMASGSSFLHLPSFTKTTEGGDWHSEVPMRMGEAMTFINSADTPPVVVMSHHWLAQMRKADLVDENGQRKNVEVKIDDILSGISKLKKQIKDGTLIVIGEVPGSGHNLYDVFTRPIPPFLSSFNPDDYLNSPADEEKQRFNRRLKEYSENTGEFYFIDPFDILCQYGNCRNLDEEGRLIYSDTHHLSKYGSREVIRSVLPRLRGIMNGMNGNESRLITSDSHGSSSIVKHERKF